MAKPASEISKRDSSVSLLSWRSERDDIQAIGTILMMIRERAEGIIIVVLVIFHWALMLLAKSKILFLSGFILPELKY